MYGERPRYIFYGGLVIQPLNLNLMSSNRLADTTTRYLTTNYLSKGFFEERPEILVLTRVESDEITSSMSGFSGSILNTINGEKVTNLEQAYKLLYETEQPDFTVMEFENVNYPLAIPSDKIKDINQRLMSTNNIPSTHFLGH